MRLRFNEPKPLPRVRGLTPDAFLRQHVAQNRPVIVTDATDDWPARRDWSPPYFRARFGDDMVQVYDDLFFMISKRPLRDYIDRFILDTARDGDKAPYIRWYSRQDARPDFPWSDAVFDKLAGEWSRPYFMPTRGLLLPHSADGEPLDPVRSHFPARGIFISALGSRTRLHIDPWASDAVLCQVYGSKRFLLFSPDQTPALTADGKLVDIRYDSASDAWTQPPAVPVADGCLMPGEVIYIPAGWAHAFQTTAPSISVTWNFVHGVSADRLAAYVRAGPPAGEARSFAYFRGEETTDRIAAS
jgi:hypothetical protein